MRILLNDFGGYPFPVELSRYLANAGHVVMHCYLSNINTPHGNMSKTDTDAAGLFIQPIVLKEEFKKYSPVGRYKGEIAYAKMIAEKIDDFKPDIFLSANTPLIAQKKILRKCRQGKINFIYWCQDIHSIALQKFFKNKLSFLGAIPGIYFKNSEVNLLKQSDHIITIAQSFNNTFIQWGIAKNKMTVIHNWGPYSEIELLDKNNQWAIKHQLDKKTVVLYSGTLGLKHNPMLIAEAARYFLNNPDLVFVVVSEGLGADILTEQKRSLGLDNLLILPFQDYKYLSQMLGSADILLAVLENDAGLFSVPSKVLTYLCSGKAILLSVPKDNLSAEIILTNNAGYCTSPGDTNGFIDKLTILMNDQDIRKKLGANGRQYAVENFPIDKIANRFLNVFENLVKR